MMVDVPTTHDPPPRIGLTVYRETAAWGVWNERADVLPSTYAEAVGRGGGVAMLLPPPGGEMSAGRAAESALDGVHGLILSGGADVDPARYAAARHERTGPARTDRDEWEIALCRAAIDRDMPLLAICRGLQILNVALGGNLYQHLPDVVGHDGHCPTPGEHASHVVRLSSGSKLAAILGTNTAVPTHHHQGLDTLGEGLTATGWAEDGIVEAVERSGASWLVGVQWHPEVRDGEPLFQAFVDACRDTLWRDGKVNA